MIGTGGFLPPGVDPESVDTRFRDETRVGQRGGITRMRAELNPVEQIWQWLKQKMLSDRTYKNYKAIEDARCQAWNRFVEDAERITGMCSRKWATIKES